MSSAPEKSAADRARLLGGALLQRGHDAAGVEKLRQALALDPGHREAHRQLAYRHIRRSEFLLALDHLRAALPAEPGTPLHEEYVRLRELAGLDGERAALPDRAGGKLRFRNVYARTHHRSGWRHALEALHPLHHAGGVLFEGFVEDPFAWQHPRNGIRAGPDLLQALRSPAWDTRLTSEERRIVPFREPWIGFMHNPPHMPRWFHYDESPQTIFGKPVWQESLRHCEGLFALSEYFAQWLREATGKPVSALVHPTETPALRFDFERFLANPRRKIVQVGWWLRRLSAIHRLPIAADNPLGYRKLRLMPDFAAGAEAHLRELLDRECASLGVRPDPRDDAIDECGHLPDAEYDTLLAENIVCIELLDASANNTVVECIARATPLLINRLPAVVEYLGDDYPLYCADVTDAAAKAMDLGRLRAAHEYLQAAPIRDRLGAGHFRRSFEASEVYRRL